MAAVSIVTSLLFYFVIRKWTCHAIVLSLTLCVVICAQVGLSLSAIVMVKIVLLVVLTVAQRMSRDSVSMVMVFNRMFLPTILFAVGIIPGFLESAYETVSLENYLVAFFLSVSPLTGYYIGLLTTQQPDFKGGSVKILVLLVPSLIVLGWGAVQGLDRLVVGSIAIGGLYGHIVFLILFISSAPKAGRLFGMIIATLEMLYGGSRRYIVPAIAVFGYLLFAAKFKNRNWVWVMVLRIIGVLTAIGLFMLLNVILSFESIVDVRGLGYRVLQNQFFLAEMQSLQDWVFGLNAGYSTSVSYSYRWTAELGPRLHNYYYSIVLNFGLWGIIFLVMPIIVKLLRSIRHDTIPIILFALGWFISALFDTPPDGLWVIGWAAAICEQRFRYARSLDRAI